MEDALCEAPKRNLPRIAVFKGVAYQYFIFMEQKVLCQTSNFQFAARYSFNLEYDKYVKDVALFFQDFVLELPDAIKRASSYTSKVADIQSHVTE